MKRVCLIFGMLLFLSVGSVHAQSIADDIEQLTLDITKLSELKQILSDMYKAYTILHGGYETVKSLSEGTFNLHKAFLDGLLAVNPAVANYFKVVDIVNKETAMVKEYQAANGYLRSSGQFTSEEMGYFLTMYNSLITRSLNNVSELIMVVTAGTLRMSDAERLAAIDRIDTDITGQLGYMHSFDNDAAMQAMQRARAQGDIGTVQGLYGIGQ
jgi:hypothetical protein